ncbi:MAG TPA: phenylacetate--CoA ligase, partial [Chloroflexota bacterium]|nr:phenylacetate--CoA ligase [Chloroflexota bacterium]
MPRERLAALQLDRLRETVGRLLGAVAPIGERLQAAGVQSAADVASLSDLARLPFTVKSDLREHYPFGLLALPREQVVRVHASSGTTGKATVVGYTRQDIEMWGSVMARSLRAAGAHSTDIVHIAYGYGLFTGGLGAHYGAEALGATVVPSGGGMTERQVRLICDFKPDIIMCTPSYLLVIADEFVRQGLDPAKSSPRVGIFGAEPWSASMQAELER